MPDQHLDIDAIVQAVIRKLRAASDADIGDEKGAHTSTADVAMRGEKPADLLRIEEKIVSVELLRQRINGATRLVTRSDAIITPAARDLVKERGLQLVRDTQQPQAAQARTQVALGIAACAFDATPLVRSSPLAQANVQRLAQAGITSVIPELCDQVSRAGALGLLLTAETAAAVCMANRRGGVRAVHGRSVEEVERALVSVGANLLVVDPTEHTTWQLSRIVAAFLHRGSSSCRQEYQPLLP